MDTPNVMRAALASALMLATTIGLAKEQRSNAAPLDESTAAVAVADSRQPAQAKPAEHATAVKSEQLADSQTRLLFLLQLLGSRLQRP
jgi:hypothetical protein